MIATTPAGRPRTPPANPSHKRLWRRPRRSAANRSRRLLLDAFTRGGLSYPGACFGDGGGIRVQDVRREPIWIGIEIRAEVVGGDGACGGAANRQCHFRWNGATAQPIRHTRLLGTYAPRQFRYPAASGYCFVHCLRHIAIESRIVILVNTIC